MTIGWPLIDLRMTRHDCLLWDHRPAEWADACDFDERIRHLRRPSDTRPVGDRHLHRSMRPLREVDLTTPADGGQTDMFAVRSARRILTFS